MPIFSAIVLAILFYPLYRATLSQTKIRAAAASGIMIALIVLLIALPLYGLGTLLAHEAITLYQSSSIDPSTFLADSFAKTPQIVSLAQNFGVSEQDLRVRLASFVQTASNWMVGFAASLTAQTIQFALQFVITLYLTFFLLKDGDSMLKSINAALPLSVHRRETLYARFVSTVRAVVKGSIVVSLVQGILGGLLFWAVGIGNPVLWGAVMAFLALLPFGGPTLIWLPAAIFLFFAGNVVGAAALVIGGALVIGLIDNVMRPILVGRDIKMPDPLVLISVLGGLAAFGPGGIVVGPVIAALFLSVWEMFAEERSATSHA